MKLPNSEDAIQTESKLRGYLLNPRGADPSKARFFAALGYTQENWQQLADDIRTQIIPLDCEYGHPNSYGQTFEIIGLLQGPQGSATIKTVWIIEEGTVAPRLVTAHPD